MPYAFKFVIPQIGVEATYSMDVVNRSYLLNDDTRIRMPRTVGWCSDCRTFQTVERLPELELIQGRLENAESASVDPQLTKLQQNRALKVIKEETLMLRWRKQRQGARRCLTCGNTSVTIAERYSEDHDMFPPGKALFEIDNCSMVVEASMYMHFR
ncbi:MAG: hypothetical protein KDA77_21300, partial [Planctomycetaceae bacterium]|nr:hypothetical protein [Planctomycetaceae bacterium]